MPHAPRQLNHLGQIQCPRCMEWNYLTSHSRDKKRYHGAGTYCLSCVSFLMKNKYGKKARERAEHDREEAALETLREYNRNLREERKPVGPPDPKTSYVEPEEDVPAEPLYRGKAPRDDTRHYGY